MEWLGMHDDESDVAEPGETEDSILENGTFRVLDEWRRRPGFGAVIANTGIVCAEISTLVVFIKSDGTIVSESQ